MRRFLALVAVVTALGLSGVLWQWCAAVGARNAADQRRLEAEARRLEAEQLQAALKREKDQAVAKLYATSIGLAHQEWLSSNVARAEELLNGCPPRLTAGNGGTSRDYAIPSS